MGLRIEAIEAQLMEALQRWEVLSPMKPCVSAMTILRLPQRLQA
jgi:hypothetical protein